MTNTEKPTGIAEQKKSAVVTPKKQEMKKTPLPKQEKKVGEKTTEKPAEKKVEEKPKEKQKTKPKIKRDFAVVNGFGIPISTKQSIAICKFIKGKKIEKAIEDLEQVIIKKKAVPMKGEYAHRKGRIMSGKYPKNASERFIKLLKTLSGNANVNEIENPIISEAIANKAARPYRRRGIQAKRTHIKIKVTEKKVRSENKKEGTK